MERVLVIDDDKLVRDSLTLTLEWAGYDVTGAASPKEGLAFLQKNAASVVVADDIHGEDDGWEQIQTLRQFSPKLPIIAISGVFSPASEPCDLSKENSGSIYYLHKPFTVDEFLSTIQTALPKLPST